MQQHFPHTAMWETCYLSLYIEHAACCNMAHCWIVWQTLNGIVVIAWSHGTVLALFRRHGRIFERRHLLIILQVWRVGIARQEGRQRHGHARALLRNDRHRHHSDCARPHGNCQHHLPALPSHLGFDCRRWGTVSGSKSRNAGRILDTNLGIEVLQSACNRNFVIGTVQASWFSRTHAFGVLIRSTLYIAGRRTSPCKCIAMHTYIVENVHVTCSGPMHVSIHTPFVDMHTRNARSAGTHTCIRTCTCT